jgi:hypothetical protein
MAVRVVDVGEEKLWESGTNTTMRWASGTGFFR